MKKILLSFGVIAITAVVAVSATGAFFSDTETSTGNTFTAGAIDLKVDSQQHYNGMVCTGEDNGPYTWQPENGTQAPYYPEQGTPCGGTWGQKDGKDIVDEQFFKFGDIKPGDNGEDTISLHVLNNDAWVCATVSGLTNFENGQTEPEAQVDQTTGVNDGELQQAMNWKVWRDDGADNNPDDGNVGVAGDNIQNGDEKTLIEGQPTNGTLAVYDPTTSTGPLAGGSTGYLGVSWSLPSTSGNETQTDSLTGDISFQVEQSRNNGDFRCNPTQPN